MRIVKGFQMNEPCSFVDVIIISKHTQTRRASYIYYLYICRTRCHDAVQEMMPVRIEMPSGGKRAAAEGKKKARTIQSLWMRYFRCRMDIRVEI